MNKADKYNKDSEQEEIQNPEQIVEDEMDDAVEAEAVESEAEEETIESKVAALEEEVAKEKKEYLFLMAEFDNFRKRTIREKADIIKNASQKAMEGLLPIVDDFERGLQAAKDTDDAASVREGMELIYNKLVKYMATNGVQPMNTDGQPFDAELHEAIAQVPAQNDDQKGHIIDTVTKGYTINGKVLRHAKVVVAQ